MSYFSIYKNRAIITIDTLIGKLDELKEMEDLPEGNSKNSIALSFEKPLNFSNLIFTTSLLHLLDYFLDLLSYNKIISDYDEIYNYIFFLFEYYIYASLNLFISSKLNQIENEDITIYSNDYYEILKIEEQAYTMQKCLKLKELLLNTKSTLCLKIFKYKKNVSYLIPKISNDIYIDNTNLYCCLIEKIVCCESYFTALKFIKRIIPIEIYKSKEARYKILLQSIKKTLYLPICQNIFNLNECLYQLIVHNWDLNAQYIKGQFNSANTFVSGIVEQIFEKYNNIILLSSDNLTYKSKSRFFSIILEFLVKKLIDAIAKIPRISIGGLNVLGKDIKMLECNLEEVIGNKEKKKSQEIFNEVFIYIKMFNLQENELLRCIKSNQFELKYIDSVLEHGANFKDISYMNKSWFKREIRIAAIAKIQNIKQQLNLNN